MLPRPHVAAAALVAALALAPAAAQSQETVLADGLTRATVVGAAGGWTAWSQRDAEGYRLVVRAPDGVVAPAPVAPRGVPFDVDLGIAAGGRPVAAYSRCTQEPTLNGGANATAPNSTSGRGCRIVVYDLRTQRERTLPRSAGARADVLPSVGGSRIAFAAALPNGRAQLRWRPLAATGPAATKARVLDRGVRRALPGGFAEGPANVDTDGTRVAVVWRSANEEFGSFDSVLRAGTFSRGRTFHQIAFGVNSEACTYDQVLAPTVAGGSVTYVETDGARWMLGRTSATRQAPTYGLARTADDPGVVITGAAVDGTRLVVAETASSGPGRTAGPTRVVELPLTPFARAAPLSFCD